MRIVLSKRWKRLGSIFCLLGAGWVAVATPPVLAKVPAPASPAPLSALAVSTAAREAAQRVLATRDHRGLPFAIVDKQAALILVYHADGALAGSSTVLLGQTLGDRAQPGTGERTRQGRLRAVDRTTPAGRFNAEPGRNLSGEAVVWLDYANAFAIHRLRPGAPGERRAQRMASPSAADKRISAGCVVVPVAFYEAVVEPMLGRGPAVVYVLPEERVPDALLEDVALAP